MISFLLFQSVNVSSVNWGLLGIPHLAELPGIRWKLHNLGQLAKFRPKKFLSQAEALERLLGS
jgi:hypothetical protein